MTTNPKADFNSIVTPRLELNLMPYDLTDGFRHHVDTYYWTTSKHCVLQLHEFQQDILLKLKVSPFLYEGCHSQTLTISCAGETILDAFNIEKSQSTVESYIPTSLLQLANGKIILSLPNAKSPHSLGLNADVDELGLFVQDIQIKNSDVSVEAIQNKIEWGLKTQANIAAMSKRVLNNASFSDTLKKTSVKRLIKIAKLANSHAETTNPATILSLITEPNFETNLKQWTDKLYLLDTVLLSTVNYLSNKSLRNYEVSPKLKKYSEHQFDTKVIKQLKAGNTALNVNEVLTGKIIINSLPPYLLISLTNICNLKCHMCYQSQIQFERFRVSDEILCKIIEYLPYNNYFSISGLGEPTLSPNYEYLAQAAFNLSCYTHSISNGTLLDKKFESLAKIKELVVSFDAATKDTFEILRAGGKFDKICQNIKFIKSTYPDIQISFSTTISRLNLPEMSNIVILAHELGVSTINFNAIIHTKYLELQKEDLPLFLTEKEKTINNGINLGVKIYMHITESHFVHKEDTMSFDALPNMIKNAPKPDKKRFNIKELEQTLLHTQDNVSPFKMTAPSNEVQDLTDQNWDKLISLQDDILQAVNKDITGDPTDDLPYCLNPWNMMYVKEDGTVRLCCNSDRYMGDLNNDSIKDVFNNENFQYARKSMLGQCEKHDECKTCMAGNRKIGIHHFQKN